MLLLVYGEFLVGFDLGFCFKLIFYEVNEMFGNSFVCK